MKCLVGEIPGKNINPFQFPEILYDFLLQLFMKPYHPDIIWTKNRESNFKFCILWMLKINWKKVECILIYYCSSLIDKWKIY